MAYPEQAYSNFQKAKTLSNYGIDNTDHVLTKQEDGRMGYVEISELTSYINLRTAEKLGWARYDDTQYTTSSVFSVLTTDGDVTLPNNAGNTIETHLHSSISFYNSGSQKIQVENDGDVYMMTIVFRAKTSNANGTSMRLQMDSTGETPYERVGKDLFFGKGNDVWHDFHEVFQYYGDADFVANGNRLKIRAVGNSVSIANIIVFIQRTQNHSI